MKCEPTSPLRADAVYLTPLGRPCRWVPSEGEHRQITSYAAFVYLDRGVKSRHAEAAGWADGFCLAPANYQLLREVANGVTAGATSGVAHAPAR